LCVPRWVPGGMHDRLQQHALDAVRLGRHSAHVAARGRDSGTARAHRRCKRKCTPAGACRRTAAIAAPASASDRCQRDRLRACCEGTPPFIPRRRARELRMNRRLRGSNKIADVRVEVAARVAAAAPRAARREAASRPDPAASRRRRPRPANMIGQRTCATFFVGRWSRRASTIRAAASFANPAPAGSAPQNAGLGARVMIRQRRRRLDSSGQSAGDRDAPSWSAQAPRTVASQRVAIARPSRSMRLRERTGRPMNGSLRRTTSRRSRRRGAPYHVASAAGELPSAIISMPSIGAPMPGSPRAAEYPPGLDGPNEAAARIVSARRLLPATKKVRTGALPDHVRVRGRRRR